MKTQNKLTDSEKRNPNEIVWEDKRMIEKTISEQMQKQIYQNKCEIFVGLSMNYNYHIKIFAFCVERLIEIIEALTVIGWKPLRIHVTDLYETDQFRIDMWV